MKRARERPAISATHKGLVRRLSRQPRTSIGLRRYRPTISLTRILPLTQRWGFPAPCRYHRHFEIRRPPGFYARLSPRPNISGAPCFSSIPGVDIASPRAPSRAAGANERSELLRSSQPEAYAETGASGPSNSDQENVELSQVLSAIAEEVYRHYAAVCQGIVSQCAARQASARKNMPKDQIAAALAMITAERRAALALARQQAKMEQIGRSQAAKALYGRRRSRPAAVPKAGSRDCGSPQPA